MSEEDYTDYVLKSEHERIAQEQFTNGAQAGLRTGIYLGALRSLCDRHKDEPELLAILTALRRDLGDGGAA